MASQRPPACLPAHCRHASPAPAQTLKTRAVTARSVTIPELMPSCVTISSTWQTMTAAVAHAVTLLRHRTATEKIATRMPISG